MYNNMFSDIIKSLKMKEIELIHTSNNITRLIYFSNQKKQIIFIIGTQQEVRYGVISEEKCEKLMQKYNFHIYFKNDIKLEALVW